MATNSKLDESIDKVIENAVEAKTEAAMLEVMASSETMRTFVMAALQKEVSVSGYSSDRKPLIQVLLKTAIEEQAREVVADEVRKQEKAIRKQVRQALKKSIGVVADSLVDGFVANAEDSKSFVQVQFNAPR